MTQESSKPKYVVGVNWPICKSAWALCFKDQEENAAYAARFHPSIDPEPLQACEACGFQHRRKPDPKPERKKVWVPLKWHAGMSTQQELLYWRRQDLLAKGQGEGRL